MKNRIVNFRIDVTKISKEKLYKGKKGTYLEVSAMISEDEHQYDTPCAIWEKLTQEERENDKKRNYIGNGKVVWVDEAEQEPKPKKSEPAKIQDLDLPF